MTYQHLQELEHRLLHDDAFEKTHVYFMDHFGEKAAFTKLSKRTNVPYLTTTIGELCRQFFKKDAIALQNLTVMKAEAFRLLHGFVQVEGLFMVFFYSKTVNRGTACLFNMANRHEGVHYFRITPITSDGSPVPETLFNDVFEGKEN
jgi:hypothetical protein